MYCPKCKDTFEQGSRRFCPNDGSRLVSDEPGAGGEPRPGGIFANLIPKIDAMSERDETLAPKGDRPIERLPNPFEEPHRPAPTEPDMPFFELDDPELELDVPAETPPSAPTTAPESSESENRPVGRKVQPFEIPAGGINLEEKNRFPSPAADFTIENPERFIGKTVKGRYRVTEFLGGDENGFSYLGEDRIVEDRKVLVRILIEDGFDEIMSSILAEERVSLSHFSHPNIARMIDSGEFSNGMNFLVSEYVDALSVDDILTIHGHFDQQRTGRVIRQASNALNEAHQEGIIHRDVRPENLVIDTLGEIEQVRVVNFGASNGDPNNINLPYKAPEVLEGRIATVASDIYSLAVVAFEMLTGHLPFEGSTEKEMLRAQRAGVVLPSRVRDDISPAVDEVFEKALAYNANDRFPKARDLGDALSTALAQQPARPARPAETNEPAPEPPVPAPIAERSAPESNIIELQPIVAPAIVPPPPPATPAAEEPAPSAEPSWKNRSPEPPATGSSWSKWIPLLLIVAILAAAAAAWYLSTQNPGSPAANQQTAVQDADAVNANRAGAATDTEMPPLPRTIPQPPDTVFYQNSKQDLRGELLRNFVGFSLFYPKSWKVNAPNNAASEGARGKFIDISRETPDGRVQEQMLISYYPSKGTFDLDSEGFPKLVKETNDTLKKILPGYEMISEGETRVNGGWKAYEVKFQSTGTTATGEKLTVWGRRLFIPAARPGTRNGFEITMLATSYSENVTGINDVGNKGDLGVILDTFEPSQNF